MQAQHSLPLATTLSSLCHGLLKLQGHGGKGGKEKPEKSPMHLLKIILVMAENCWQLQPHRLSSCRVASNPSCWKPAWKSSGPSTRAEPEGRGGICSLKSNPVNILPQGKQRSLPEHKSK